MASLSREHRKLLEKTVKEARVVADAAAEAVLAQLGVAEAGPPAGLPEDRKALRRRLRAHGRGLGDVRDPEAKTQRTRRLAAAIAYEHWHRLLFARFLAENDLLLYPEGNEPITLAEVRELAEESNDDWVALAGSYAERMLPEIFRTDDPVLTVKLPLERRVELERLLRELPPEVFASDDGLGWVYQFWQAEEKDRVNASGDKIGADELPAVTQLFTEDYMVLFLLHNTLGAWWAGRKLAENPALLDGCGDEAACRAAVALPGVNWEYLRFVRDEPQEDTEGPGRWRPAAGTFPGWPGRAAKVTVLDPCMGSGHFLTFALPMLVELRKAEEPSLTDDDAVDAVLAENLHGLELDPRCTQIAAFNVALAAWRRAGRWRPLPALNLACTGRAPNTPLETWHKLAAPLLEGESVQLREAVLVTLEDLHAKFSDAPVLGSLIDVTDRDPSLIAADWETVAPYLERATAHEYGSNGEAADMHADAVTARGIADAAKLLAGPGGDEARGYTLVVTNVPYLARPRQNKRLRDVCEEFFFRAKADLAAALLERSLGLTSRGCTSASVSPQSWLSLSRYKNFREFMLRNQSWDWVARLGTGAFETISGEVVTIALTSITREQPGRNDSFVFFDAAEGSEAARKAELLRTGKNELSLCTQREQLSNPDSRVVFGARSRLPTLSKVANSWQGIRTSDDNRFVRSFFESPTISDGWVLYQRSPSPGPEFTGRESVLFWEDGHGQMTEVCQDGAPFRGQKAWGRLGVCVKGMGNLYATIYTGEHFSADGAILEPQDQGLVAAVWCFATSPAIEEEVRKLNPSLFITNSTFKDVPFDLPHWQQVAEEKYPDGLPEPESDNPTQWLFHGRPEQSKDPLQVAVARLLGYRWPAESDPEMRLSERARDLAESCEELAPHADEDGIVTLAGLGGEAPAADRLHRLLVDAYGHDWSEGRLDGLLADAAVDAGLAAPRKNLRDWLREDFFKAHCRLFGNRPFVWHLWDGLKEGFHAFVNYHALAAPDGGGQRTLEKLIYTHLSEWISRQEQKLAAGEAAAEERRDAALHLKGELEKILAGEPPYDLFVRWKPLHEQPIGWNPDVNDGVRLNARPFLAAKPAGMTKKSASIFRHRPTGLKYTKDRGKEPARDREDYPWFWQDDPKAKDDAGFGVNYAGGAEFTGNRWNDLHYTTAFKQAARARKGTGDAS